MSIERCEIHDKHWDSDKREACRQCEIEEGMRPQDETLDGAGWKFEMMEHGGRYPDTMPQVIKATDSDGRSWTYEATLRPMNGKHES